MTGAAKVAGVAALAGVGVGALSSLIGGNSTADPFMGTQAIFPEELPENDHWIQFTAFETKGYATDAVSNLIGNANISGTSVKGGSIYLPMPANLSTDYNPLYDEKSLGLAAGAALKPFDRSMYGNRDLETELQMGTGSSALSVAGEKFAGGLALQGAINTIGAGIGGVDNVSAALKVFGGIATNPHKMVLFTGVGFREHSFSWKLSPKNRTESDAIRMLIEMFKFYSHPEYLTGGLFFKYPEFFRINFRHPQYLFELEPSVCTGVRVNYHGQGFPAYVRDSDGGGIPAPVEIELQVTFKETEIITKNTLTRGMRVMSTQGQNVPPKPPNQAESVNVVPMNDTGLPLFTPGA
jgi:hypothetical protein